MTCLEAQSHIMEFIEKKLPDEKVDDFVRHMRYCKNCSEELEIYYTLIVGMRELDNNEELSKDFKKELDAELERLSNRVRKVKRFKISTFSVVCISLIVLFTLFYNSILGKAYTIEQHRIKVLQGEHYFYDTFSDYIDMCNEDIYIEGQKILEIESPDFYDLIHRYNEEHIREEEDE